MDLSPCNTCVKSGIGYCTLSSYEQKPPPFSKYSSLMGHNRLCKHVTKKRKTLMFLHNQSAVKCQIWFLERPVDPCCRWIDALEYGTWWCSSGTLYQINTLCQGFLKCGFFLPMEVRCSSKMGSCIIILGTWRLSIRPLRIMWRKITKECCGKYVEGTSIWDRGCDNV